MKTFKDFLDKENKEIHFDLPTNVEYAIIQAQIKFQKYQEQQTTQEEWKKEIIKHIEENEIIEIKLDPNYINKSKYNDSFHPPEGYKSRVSLLTIAFKNKK